MHHNRGAMVEGGEEEQQAGSGDAGGDGEGGRQVAVGPLAEPAGEKVAEQGADAVETAEESLDAGAVVALGEGVDEDLTGDHEAGDVEAVEPHRGEDEFEGVSDSEDTHGGEPGAKAEDHGAADAEVIEQGGEDGEADDLGGLGDGEGGGEPGSGDAEFTEQQGRVLRGEGEGDASTNMQMQ